MNCTRNSGERVSRDFPSTTTDIRITPGSAVSPGITSVLILVSRPSGPSQVISMSLGVSSTILKINEASSHDPHSGHFSSFSSI